MDILDILLDILLKPPQPFIGLFINNRVLKYGFLGYVVGFLQNKQGTNVVDGN